MSEHNIFNAMSKKKTSKGRQRIEIKQLEKQSTKEVTFSKRRAGLFKKAGELCVLCAAEVGIIVFSPARKPYCFGHPNIEAILQRYLSNNTSSEPAKITLPVQEYNHKYEKSAEEFKEEKKKATVKDDDNGNDEALKAVNKDLSWVDEPLGNKSVEEIHEYLTALQELRKKVASRVDALDLGNNGMFVGQFGNVQTNNGVGSAFYGIFNGGGHGLF